ncbi:MAG TPA: hypothetical protein VLT33_27240 [Labilithrix sp.]|nr:hypothetical protein [Labilithrix sp.]
MRSSSLLLGFVAVSGSLIFACGSSKNSGFDDGTGGSSGSSGSSSGILGNPTGEGGAGKPCAPAAGNFDIPGNGCDDDNDGTIDNPPSCDGSLAASGSAEEFAKAIGLCATAAKDGYGLVSAKFTRGYNRDDAPKGEQHGVLAKFGDVIKPREGKQLGVLSTGYAQEYNGGANTPFGGTTGTEGSNSYKLNGKNWWNWNALFPTPNGSAPPGFPKAADGCMQGSDVNDVIDVKLEIKAPANAAGVKFDFNFYSGEWPAFICSPFNDGFIAYLSAKGFNGGKPDNMSFDAKKNPVSVNNGFFDRCTAGVDTGCADGAKAGTSACPGGPSELAGTGFGIGGAWCGGYAGSKKKQSVNGGATGWLTSQAPIQAGETFTLELMIWDTGDPFLDSSVLIDNFSWAEGDVTVSTDRPR